MNLPRSGKTGFNCLNGNEVNLFASVEGKVIIQTFLTILEGAFGDNLYTMDRDSFLALGGQMRLELARAGYDCGQLVDVDIDHHTATFLYGVPNLTYAEQDHRREELMKRVNLPSSPKP